MKEIRFKFWDLKNKEFPLMLCLSDAFAEYENMKNKDRYIPLQYTWLKDKNGKEIYEGDIVYLAWYGNYEITFPFIPLYVWLMENDIGAIVWNIYENPELLTK